MISKNTKRAIGYILLFIGIIALGDQLNIWHLPLVFLGWWAFLIIVPFLADILKKGIKPANTVGLICGLLFLSYEWKLLPLQNAATLLLPLAVIVLAVVILTNR